MHEHALTINYTSSNNALIVGLRLASLIDTKDLIIYNDSKLLVNQLTGEYGARDD